MLSNLLKKYLLRKKYILNTSLYAAVCAPQFVTETKYTVKKYCRFKVINVHKCT